MAGYRKTQETVRLFMVPDMQHCARRNRGYHRTRVDCLVFLSACEAIPRGGHELVSRQNDWTDYASSDELTDYSLSDAFSRRCARFPH